MENPDSYHLFFSTFQFEHKLPSLHRLEKSSTVDRIWLSLAISATLCLAGCNNAPARESYFTSIELLESAVIPLPTGETLYSYRSGAMRDMNGDGVADALLTITTFPQFRPNPIVVVDGAGSIADISAAVFPKGVPAVRHSNQVFFRDIDGDGRDDLLISEAGLDYFPWVTNDTRIVVAMNRGSGIFEDMSSALPESVTGVRAYSLGVGDFYGDGTVRIVHPGQSSPYIPTLISWNGSEFISETNWVDPTFWYPGKFLKSSNLQGRDLDGDGYDDLYLSGTFETPTHRVIYGGADFASVAQSQTLTEGPCGHTPWETFLPPDVTVGRGADVNEVLIEDFNGDGDLDIVAFEEEILYFKPGVFENSDWGDWTSSIVSDGGSLGYNIWFQVLVNTGGRKFVDISNRLEKQNLGMRYYPTVFPIDIDLDGDLDIVGHYFAKEYNGLTEPRWGTTVFFNNGHASFTALDIRDVLGDLEAYIENDSPWSGMGAMFPTQIDATSVTGLLIAPVEDDPNAPHLRVLRFRAMGRFHTP